MDRQPCGTHAPPPQALSGTFRTSSATSAGRDPGRPASRQIAQDEHLGERSAGSLVVSPAGDFDRAGAGTGRYSTADVGMAGRITYRDFAVALLDEIGTPLHHRTHIGVEEA
ncbi:hypothetical protein [Streptomyces sp. NPDC053720]|uniref:hypothetical protein n=1 Tax=Streptomyces sp. NPDC053720 TaxID=3154855 RepID=UPI00343453D6